MMVFWHNVNETSLIVFFLLFFESKIIIYKNEFVNLVLNTLRKYR